MNILRAIRQSLTNLLKKIKKSSLIKKIYTIVFQVLDSILPVEPKLVIFESFLGKQFSDNPRAIYEYLKGNQMGYKMYWSFDGKNIGHYKDRNIRSVRRLSFKWLVLMSRAGYWVTNSRLPLWIPKPKHTIYVQTWHGTPLKRLAADMDQVHLPGTTAEKYKQEFIEEAQKWDYLISPNKYSTEIFRRAFQFDKKIIESGYPRNDYLFTNNNKKSIKRLKKKLGIPVDKKIILYAPTWRDNQYYEIGKYRFELNLDLEKMREILGEDYVILLRLHYFVSNNLRLDHFVGFVYDLSDYEDIRNLYLVSDLLITDYSSVFFDFAILNRPMLFYVYDIEEYRDKLRGFYMDFEKEAPGPLFMNTEELISGILELSWGEFRESEEFKAFREKYCVLNTGKSSELVVQEIFTK